MRVAVEINLSDRDHKILKKNVGSRSSSVRLVGHSKIILLAAEGLENRAIAERLNLTPNTVGTWRNRFAEEGIKVLEKENPRRSNHGGKKSMSQRRLRQKIIQKTTQEKPDNATYWSTRTMAEALNTTHSFVNRVWKSVGLKPHLEKQFKVSNDPNFEEKLCDVVGLYLNPPKNTVVILCG